ncbi:MAG: hypothetical protein AAFQ82_20775 [Myxococcota bacterium]
MQCKDALQAVLDARYEGREPPPEAMKVLQQPECRELLERARKLDDVLGLDEPHEPGPGFDTRFFAKLEEQKRSRSKRFLPWVGALAVGAAAATIFVLAPPKVDEPADPNGAELAMMRDLELLEEIEVVEKLEEVEAFELLAALDPDTLDRLIEEELP